jgi:hypothetical protein
LGNGKGKSVREVREEVGLMSVLGDGILTEEEVTKPKFMFEGDLV